MGGDGGGGGIGGGAHKHLLEIDVVGSKRRVWAAESIEECRQWVSEWGGHVRRLGGELSCVFFVVCTNCPSVSPKTLLETQTQPERAFFAAFYSPHARSKGTPAGVIGL